MMTGFGAGKERREREILYSFIYASNQITYPGFFGRIKGTYGSGDKVAKYEERMKAVNNQKLYLVCFKSSHACMHAIIFFVFSD